MMKTLKRMLLIFNPKSGTQKFANQLFEVVNKLSAAGFLVSVYSTQAHGEVGNIIINHVSDYEHLVCSGGDGTIREAIEALMALEKRPVFGIIPSGTVNDFTSSLGIPKDIMAACDIVINSVSNALDIGRFGDKYFSYVAAFGMYTDVSYSTPQHIKNLFGKFAYFLEGVKRGGTLRPFGCKFVLDGEEIIGEFILGIVANAHSIAGYKLSEEMGVHIDDGYFEVILVHMPSNILDRQKIIASFIAQEAKTDLVIIRKAKKVEFASNEPIAWTLDGDFGGQHTEVVIENQHHALEVIMPSRIVSL